MSILAQGRTCACELRTDWLKPETTQKRFPVTALNWALHTLSGQRHTSYDSLGFCAKFSCRCTDRYTIMIMCISPCGLKVADEPQRTRSSSRADVMLPGASGVHRGEDPSGRLMRSSLLICFHVFSCNTLNYLLSTLLLRNAEKHSFKCAHLLMAPAARYYLMRQDEE